MKLYYIVKYNINYIKSLADKRVKPSGLICSHNYNIIVIELWLFISYNYDFISTFNLVILTDDK